MIWLFDVNVLIAIADPNPRYAADLFNIKTGVSEQIG